MRRRSVFSLFSVTLIAVILSGSQFTGESTSFDLNNPLPLDNRIIQGKLPNGFKYLIWPIDNGEKIYLTLRLKVGNFHEKKNEQGVAHFIEHMAFNGSINFPSRTINKKLAAYGMTLGKEHNGSTGNFATRYDLVIPDNNAEALETGLQFLSDISNRLSFDSKEIEREKNILIEEENILSSAFSRVANQFLGDIFPQLLFARTAKNSLIPSIKKTNKLRLEKFYRRWYRPDRTTIIITGNVSIKGIKSKITRYFSEWQLPEQATEEQDIVDNLAKQINLRPNVYTDTDQSTAQVQVMTFFRSTKINTYEDYRKILIHRLTNLIVNRRTLESYLEGNILYSSLSTKRTRRFPLADALDIYDRVLAEEWDESLLRMWALMNGIVKKGFREHELRWAKDKYIKNLISAEGNDLLYEASVYHQEIIESLDDGTIVIKPKMRTQISRKILNTISVKVITEWAKEAYAINKRKIMVVVPSSIVKPTVIQILKLTEIDSEYPLLAPIKVSKEIKFKKPPSRNNDTAIKYDDFTKVTSFTIENGVLGHVRPITTLKGEFKFRLMVGGGQILESINTRGLSDFVSDSLEYPHTTDISALQIHDYLESRDVEMDIYHTKASIIFNISGKTKYLPDIYSLLYSILSDPRIQDWEENSWKYAWKKKFLEEKNSFGRALRLERSKILYPGDIRFREINKKDVETKTAQQAEKWLQKWFREGPIEMAVVGDVKPEEIIRLTNDYLGGLPKRMKPLLGYKKERTVKSFRGSSQTTLTVKNKNQFGLVSMSWPAPDTLDYKAFRNTKAAARILGERIYENIREKEGLIYSSVAKVYDDKSLFGDSRLNIAALIDQNNIKKILVLIPELFTKYLNKGPTLAEINSINIYEQRWARNVNNKKNYWINLLSSMEYNGDSLQSAHYRIKKAATHTQVDMKKFFRETFIGKNYIRFVVIPAKK